MGADRDRNDNDGVGMTNMLDEVFEAVSDEDPKGMCEKSF